MLINTSRYSFCRQSAFSSSCFLKIYRFFRMSTVNSTSETENNKISRICGPIHSTSTTFLFIMTIMVSYEYHTIPSIKILSGYLAPHKSCLFTIGLCLIYQEFRKKNCFWKHHNVSFWLKYLYNHNVFSKRGLYSNIARFKFLWTHKKS